MDGGMWAWVLFGMLILAVVVPGIVLVMVWVMQKTVGSGVAPEGPDSPLEILKKRYARGEITKDEFDKIRRDILP